MTHIYMKHLLICALTIFALCACKPTESGYRRAYEKTVGAGDNDTDQIFTPMGADLTMQKIVVGNDTADCASAFVSVTPGIGNPPTRLKPFCVVAGGFRQKFTAADLCRRLIGSGCDSAFVVNTSKPRYYVVAASCADAGKAMERLRKLRHDSVAPRDGFILRPAGL